jgi:hypothetical protein
MATPVHVSILRRKRVLQENRSALAQRSPGSRMDRGCRHGSPLQLLDFAGALVTDHARIGPDREDQTLFYSVA